MKLITRTLSNVKPKPLPRGVSSLDAERQMEERGAAVEAEWATFADEDDGDLQPASVADLHHLLPSTEPLSPPKIPRVGCLDEAKSYLLHSLADGPQAAAFLLTEAAKVNIAKRTLDRAKKFLSIRAEKRGAVWFWRLP